jgi:hypothetical protein
VAGKWLSVRASYTRAELDSSRPGSFLAAADIPADEPQNSLDVISPGCLKFSQ